MKNFKLIAAVAAVSIAMTGCATTKAVQETSTETVSQVKGLFDLKKDEVKVSDEVTFPAIEKAKFSSNNYKGSWPNWSNVGQIEHGMSKDQLYNLIGHPHYREGLFNVKKWDYIFNYRDAGTHKQCQYQIHFDKDMTVKGMYWADPSCAELAKEKPSVIQQTVVNNITQQMPAPQVATLKETLVLNADALFAFDKFGISDIRADGIAKLNKLAASLQDSDRKGEKVVAYVIGHTDRLGDEAYNLDLSKKRADSVVGYLLSKGVKPVSLNALGAGEYMPVKQGCDSGTKPQMVDCLQPNRRVEVQIYVHK